MGYLQMTRNVESIFGAVVTAPHQIPYTYTATGGETFISLPFYPVTGIVTINGGMQVPLDNFEIDGNTLNLGRALSKGDVVFCLFDKILSPEDHKPGIRIYKFQSVGGETEFTPDFTSYGVQSLYIGGEYKTPEIEYSYNSTTGKVSLQTALTAGVWVVAEMSVKQPNISPLFDRSIQEIARSANVKDSEVILSTDTTQVLNGKKVVYSVSEQKAYGLPVLPTNVYIHSVVNGKLTYNPGSVIIDLLPTPSDALTIHKDFRVLLASPEGANYIGGDLLSYGADGTGVSSSSDAINRMLADGVFVVPSGKYLLTTPHIIDVSTLKKIYFGPDVEFIIKTNISGLIFKNVLTDVVANGARITVDIPGGGYSNVALTVRGTKYYTAPGNLGRLTQKTKFGPFYVYNRQGAIKQEAATAPVTDEGYGFSIDCNSSDEEILIWNDMDVSSTGFTVAHAMGVGTNPLNFISSLSLKLVAWFSTYHFRDTSIPKSGGNVAGGIGDVHVRLQSQPHAQMLKVVHMEHAPGFMSGCRFDLSIWDPNAYGYTANVVDASVTNEYTNTMERKAYPLTRVLNMVDGSIFPVVNYTSSIQQSDILSSSDPELAKYLYLSTVTPEMTVLQACNAIKTWCNENNIRNNFEFKVFLGDSTVDIRNVFLPWIAAIGDSSGYLHLYATFYNGIINTVRVEYEVNPITSGGKTEKHEILWTNATGLVSHRLVEYSFGTTAEIKSKAALQTKGFTTFDSTFNVPVWYDGNGSWLKADGAVAYSN